MAQLEDELVTQTITDAIHSVFQEAAELQKLRAKKTLNTQETARLYGIGKNTLEQMRMNGKGPDYSQVGENGSVYYTHKSIESWLEKHRIPING